MRLLSITQKESAYIIKAKKERKFLGAFIYSRVEEYIYKDGTWYEVGKNLPVSHGQSSILSKWLQDHQKFIEHT